MVFGKLSEDGRSLELSDGSLHPMAGFGTYKIGFVPASSNTAGQAGHDPERDPKEIIKDAVAAGYRYIDCAQFYGNEKIVGTALAECGVPRRDLYIVSKVWGDQIYNGREAVLAQLDRTLEDLGIEHLDLYLLHWPVPGKHVAAYQVLEEALAAGKIKAIGISNYTKEDYLEVAAVCKVKPLVNQIEMNPFLWRKNTYDFFMAQSIAIQSYRALRQAKEMENAALVSMAAKYGKTPAQRKIIVIAKTVRPERMRENQALFDFELSEEEMRALDQLTTPEALEDFKALYLKCIVRDTPLEKLPVDQQGLPSSFTVD